MKLAFYIMANIAHAQNCPNAGQKSVYALFEVINVPLIVMRLKLNVKTIKSLL